MPHDILPDVSQWGKAALLAFAMRMLAEDALSPELLLLSRIKSKAAMGLSHVPAYACAETVTRSESMPGRPFEKVDELKLDVAEIGGKELYSRAGEGKFQDTPLTEMIGRGLVSTGMFYHIAGTVFTGSGTRFEYGARKTRQGRTSARYDFRIAPLFARYRLRFNGYDADCGMKGWLLAEEASHDLITLHVEATDIPPLLGVRSAVTEIQYSRASIGGSSFLLPASSEVLLTRTTGAQERNRVRFSNCRKYGTESTLSFQ